MAQAQDAITINIRAKVRQRDLIDQAAERLGRSRSDFMLDASCKAAEDVLLDHAPPQVSSRLLRTLSAKAPWEHKR